MSARRASPIVVAATLAALALSGCTPADPFADLPTAELSAAMAAGVEDYAGDDVRLLGEDGEGATFYLVQAPSKPERRYCLVIALEDVTGSSCSSGLPLAAGVNGVNAEVRADEGLPLNEGEERIGKFLVVSRAGS